MSTSDSLATFNLPNRVVGTVAKDPGANKRWLWSVCFPSHTCRHDPCKIPARPQTYRYGHAPSYEAARDAIQDALALGPPERMVEGSAQYVNP